MRRGISDVHALVGVDALLLVMPLFHQFTDRAFHQHRKVSADESGVSAGQVDLATEGKIVAYEDLSTGNDSTGERFVITALTFWLLTLVTLEYSFSTRPY